MIIISVYVCQCQAGIHLGPYNMCQMSIFSTVVCPAVPLELGGGGTTQIWGHAKNFSGVCAPNFKTVLAPVHRPICVWGVALRAK